MSARCISAHEARFFSALNQSSWQTSAELAAKAEVSGGAARQYALRLKKAGIVEVRKLYPGYRYRLASNPAPESMPYLKELQEAVDAFRHIESECRAR